MNNTEQFFSRGKNMAAAVLSAAVVGILVSLIFFDYQVGAGYFVFSMVCFALIAYIMYLDDNLNIKQFIFWAVIYLAYASILIRLNRHAAWDILALPVLLVCLTIFAAREKTDRIFPVFVFRFFAFPVYFFKIFTVTGNNAEKKKGNMFLRILLGISISAVLLLIIIPLMAGADDMFKNLLERLFSAENFSETITRVIVSVITALAGFGFIYVITAKKKSPVPLSNARVEIPNAAVTVITVLVIIASVFLIFSAIQLRYLFINTNGLPEGYTHTEYAVDGYWEQFVLTLINMLIIMASARLTDGASGKEQKITNILMTALIAMDVYLVVSAAYRMNLYQQAYGFTYLRCLVYLILLFELICLGLMTAKVFKREFPLFKQLIYTGAAFFAVVAMMNLEAFSVNQSIRRFENTGKIDVRYIAYDCKDAGRQMRNLYFEHHEDLSPEQLLIFEEMAEASAAEKPESLLEFNLARYRRSKSLKEIAEYASAK